MNPADILLSDPGTADARILFADLGIARWLMIQAFEAVMGFNRSVCKRITDTDYLRCETGTRIPFTTLGRGRLRG